MIGAIALGLPLRMHLGVEPGDFQVEDKGVLISPLKGREARERHTHQKKKTHPIRFLPLPRILD